MGNDYRNPFSRANKGKPAASQESKEMSLSQRLDRVRGGATTSEQREGAHPNWRPSRPEDRATLRTAPQTTEAAPRKTASGVLESPDLAAARIAEQQRREALKTQATGLAKRAEFVPDDFQATMIGWLVINSVENGGTFELTTFNVSNLERCVCWQVMSGQPGWTKFGISELDAAHAWLTENGYYESAQQKRAVAGFGRAAKEFPVWKPQDKTEPVRSGNAQVFIKQDETSVAEARKLSFEELQAAARSNYKPDRR
jgi:hypothetical protein